jgi:AmmeMemoRadiSam system protein A
MSTPTDALSNCDQRHTEPELSSQQGSVLLHIARSAIEGRLTGKPHPPAAPDTPPDDWLRQHRATFVTLHIGSDLRGCIGTVEPVRALDEDVHSNALAAAFEDHRFPALATSELDEVSIEVSLLSSPVPIAARHEEEALALLVPGTHGVVLRHAGRRATFLPQVWAALPDKADFLAALREKCGLDPTFWHASIELSTYTVTHWSEVES